MQPGFSETVQFPYKPETPEGEQTLPLGSCWRIARLWCQLEQRDKEIRSKWGIHMGNK